MSHNTLIVIPLFVILSGCAAFGAAVESAALAGLTESPKTTKQSKVNYYEPIVIWSNGDAISIKYLTVNSNAMHEEVIQLINENCDGSYIETSRQEIEGWTTVDAECTKNTNN